jgi:hypothetical protein
VVVGIALLFFSFDKRDCLVKENTDSITVGIRIACRLRADSDCLTLAENVVKSSLYVFMVDEIFA